MNEQMCSICSNEIEPTTIINQPKDLCFTCWFKKDIVSEPYPCGCEKEKSLKWFYNLRNAMIIFWITSTSIAATLTILYHLGIR